MGPSGISRLWGAEFKNRWYTGIGWSFLPLFHDLKSRPGESDQRVVLKEKAGETLAKRMLYTFWRGSQCLFQPIVHFISCFQRRQPKIANTTSIALLF